MVIDMKIAAHGEVDKLYEHLGQVLNEGFVVLEDNTLVTKDGITLGQALAVLARVRQMILVWPLARLYWEELAEHLEWLEKAMEVIREGVAA